MDKTWISYINRPKRPKKQAKSVSNFEKISNMTNCRKISLLITKSENTSLEGGKYDIYCVFPGQNTSVIP